MEGNNTSGREMKAVSNRDSDCCRALRPARASHWLIRSISDTRTASLGKMTVRRRVLDERRCDACADDVTQALARRGVRL